MTLSVIVLMAGLILIGAGCGAQNTTNQTTPNATPTPTETDSYSGWETYTNNVYHYAFKHPASAKIEGKECVQVNLTYGYVSFNAPGSEEVCGRTGVGVTQETISKEEIVTINGKAYTATGHEFINPGDTLANHNETLTLRLDDGTRIEFGSKSDKSLTFSDYLTERPELIKIVESYQPR